MNALQGFLNSSRGGLDILQDRIFYWVVEMWWGAIVTIRTFFKGKNLVGESPCGGGGGSWWRKDEQIWKTQIYFNIENT